MSGYFLSPRFPCAKPRNLYHTLNRDLQSTRAVRLFTYTRFVFLICLLFIVPGSTCSFFKKESRFKVNIKMHMEEYKNVNEDVPINHCIFLTVLKYVRIYNVISFNVGLKVVINQHIRCSILMFLCIIKWNYTDQILSSKIQRYQLDYFFFPIFISFFSLMLYLMVWFSKILSLCSPTLCTESLWKISFLET